MRFDEGSVNDEKRFLCRPGRSLCVYVSTWWAFRLGGVAGWHSIPFGRYDDDGVAK